MKKRTHAALCALGALGGLFIPGIQLLGADNPAVEQVSPTEFRLGDISFHADSREIHFPAQVNAENGFLEYALVHENGKVHESLFATAISPTDLQIVLKLLRYEAGRGDLFHDVLPPGDKPRGEPLGARLEFLVSWPGLDPTPVQDFILDQAGGGPMPRIPWVLNGSEIIGGRFQAEQEGSIFALYLDPLALCNTLHPLRISDENWFPVPNRLPPYGTPVALTIRPARETPEG